ncbi:hypothetical protein TRVL_10265 [Trypanosoma vivax]|nr:hypothetical protein TRVL_10265 [Trypanosoma vivax]
MVRSTSKQRMANARQRAQASRMNNSRAPQKMKLKWPSNATLLSKRPVQEGKRSPYNCDGTVGMEVYKALRAYKNHENRAQITIIRPQQHKSAQARIPEINTHNAAIKSAHALQAQKVAQRVANANNVVLQYISSSKNKRCKMPVNRMAKTKNKERRVA